MASFQISMQDPDAAINYLKQSVALWRATDEEAEEVEEPENEEDDEAADTAATASSAKPAAKSSSTGNMDTTTEKVGSCKHLGQDRLHCCYLHH
jgi:hypothetical protein